MSPEYLHLRIVRDMYLLMTDVLTNEARMRSPRIYLQNTARTTVKPLPG